MKFLSFFLIFSVITLSLQAQTDCPRIYRRGDTLFTDPAPRYQWFKGGLLINGATNQWFLPGSKGDYSVEISGTAPKFPVFPAGSKTVYGRIVDERYEPVSEAKVSAGGKSVLTDKTGSFSLRGLDESLEKTVLTVEKPGFWKNTQSIRFFGNSAPVTAMLEPLRVTNRFEAEKGATISERGFFLTFPPNSVVNDKGEVYTGTVHLSLKRSFPNEEGFGLRMPGGDFSAIDGSGNERMLVSYGFMSAEMQSPAGEKLNLAKDKEATLEFYLPWNEVKAAPDSMPLWHFDEAAAVWRPEGMARKVGPRYVGTVKHFSSWNCDVPQNRATVKGRVVDCKKKPVSVQIPIKVGQRYVTADVDGNYTSFVPSETQFDVTASVDTLNVTQPLTEGEERNLNDLEAVTMVKAVGLIDSSGSMNVWGAGLKEYSINRGGTFFSKSRKLTFKDSYPTEGVARDSGNCERKFGIYIVPKQQDCQLLDPATLNRQPVYESFKDALNANEVVYRLRLNGISRELVNISAASFTCIQHFYLQRNQLTSVPERIMELTNLQTLSLDDNQLKNLPESIGQLSKLHTLNLSVNQLTNVPEITTQLSNLESLLLSENQLTTLSESIGQLTKLQELWIGRNQLTNLPESIGQLFNLEKLDLSDNQLTGLPESITQMANLQNLDLGNNRLTNLPEKIWQLTALQTLDLSENRLMTITESLWRLTQLKTLWLNGTRLTTIPEGIGQLTELQSLSLASNRLTTLPESIEQLSKLEYLDLYNTKLTSFPKSVIKLVNIKELNLRFNILTILPDSIRQLVNLKWLRLSNNQLTTLPESVGQLMNLQTLDLSQNQLTTLPASIANLKNTLKQLELTGNPIPAAEQAKIRSWLPNTTIYF